MRLVYCGEKSGEEEGKEAYEYSVGAREGAECDEEEGGCWEIHVGNKMVWRY